MKLVNIEVKAKTNNLLEIEQKLLDKQAEAKGVDHQIDTYFNVSTGRLKLRRGTIERSLIYYNRIETEELKASHIILNRLTDDEAILRQQLEAALGIKSVVDKQRSIYYIDNVKFHLDKVEQLGTFVEIEAIGQAGEEEKLTKQCEYYITYLAIDKEDFIAHSYSDMVSALD